MNKTVIHFLEASTGPLVTLGCTLLVMRAFGLQDESGKAVGAASAAIVLFVLTQGIELLPKKSGWWRRHFDSRAAFEGWWLQLHDANRVAVFSFVYRAEGDTFEVKGDAFDPGGKSWADWHSTELFFGTGALEVNYLFKGTIYEPAVGDREGTTTMLLDRTGRGAPISGTGKVLHLMEARRLDFRIRRVTPEYLTQLGLTFDIDALGDFERRKQLAIAYLAKQGGHATAITA